MIALDEDAVICDLAEVYHIYDMRSFDCMYIATLVKGLKDTSRIKMLAAGLETSVDRLLLAHLIDNTAINVWMKTEDAQKGKNRPKSFVTMLTEKIDESKLTKPFETSADFEAEWRRLNGI